MARIGGFKGLIQIPVSAETIDADSLVCTDEHLDRTDTEDLAILAKPKAQFAAPIECMKEFDEQGIVSSPCDLIESVSIGPVVV